MKSIRTDVVVVGGGVVGCATARELAPDYDVTLFERDALAGGATGRAAGEVTMVPSYTDFSSIGSYATDFFRSYDGTGSFAFHEVESLEFVTPDVEAVARRRVDRLAGDGVDVSFLEPDELERAYPRVDASRYAGAVRHEETGCLDPYTLTTTLAADAVDEGATIETETAVDGLCLEDGRVVGVETDAGTVRARHVVVAAGWRTERFLREHVRLPVRPYRTQCVVLRPESPLPTSFPMGWIPGEHVYFRRERNGDLLVGGWSFATDDPEYASRSADEDFRTHVANLLPTVFRRMDRARYVDGWAGVDGATPDTRPIVDAPIDALDGLIVATGFHGRGVMTAPVAARAIRGRIADDPPPFSTAPFELERFDDRSREFEFVSISDGGDVE
ncbi:NAD(P)/FAD-dependent oxidoreductase [Natrialbaceae archaeon GCM10025810]|uniref:NAD(P)/FAD-dependent oxidoreductase n=1 Tax=Halovalidus salilacus TaxID=3075124 RepID=UPI00361071D9